MVASLPTLIFQRLFYIFRRWRLLKLTLAYFFLLQAFLIFSHLLFIFIYRFLIKNGNISQFFYTIKLRFFGRELLSWCQKYITTLSFPPFFIDSFLVRSTFTLRFQPAIWSGRLKKSNWLVFRQSLALRRQMLLVWVTHNYIMI